MRNISEVNQTRTERNESVYAPTEVLSGVIEVASSYPSSYPDGTPFSESQLEAASHGQLPEDYTAPLY